MWQQYQYMYYRKEVIANIIAMMSADFVSLGLRFGQPGFSRTSQGAIYSVCWQGLRFGCYSFANPHPARCLRGGSQGELSQGSLASLPSIASCWNTDQTLLAEAQATF